MTLSSLTSKVVYVGDESTTTFSYPFKALNDTDLVLTRFNTSTLSSTVLVLNTDYQVTGVGDDSGGNVILTGSVAAVSAGTIYVHTGHQLVIQRVVPLTQLTDYVANDAFGAETHEAALDKLAMADQQLQEQLDRAIKADITQTTGSTTYVEIVNASVAASASSAAVAVSSAATTVLAEGYSLSAAASAVLASLSAASVSSNVTAALDNLTPTAINESLVPGVTLNVNLGSGSELWSNSYISLVSSNTLDVSGTGSIGTIRTTLLTAGGARITGTTNAITLAATLLTATTVYVSGTGSFTTISAGNIAVYDDTSHYAGSFTRDVSIASGTQVITLTGISWVPRAILFITHISATSKMSIGMATPANLGNGVGDYGATSAGTWFGFSVAIQMYFTAGVYYTGTVTTWSAGAVTITWVKTGFPTGTLECAYLAFR